MRREKQPRLAEHPGLDVDQRRLAVKMPDDMLKAIERDQNWLRNHAGRILKQDERLTLVLDAPRHHRPEFRSFE